MNLFNFDYEEVVETNKDGSPSKWSKVYGEAGMVMHCKKDSYHLVKTEDVSLLGSAFMREGYTVSTFTHNKGEVIGLRIRIGSKLTKVGEKNYSAIITIPNNGSGRGYLTIYEVRLICTNGATRQTNNGQASIKIPHTVDYKWALDTMQKSLQSFTQILAEVEEDDNKRNDTPLTSEQVMYHLNNWFYHYEVPDGHKEDISFNEFRRLW